MNIYIIQLQKICKKNKYTKWYINIIEKSLLRFPDTRESQRKKINSSFGYVERHHILARCMDGPDTNENMVWLSAKEHFLCHLLLVRMTDIKEYKQKNFYSLIMLMGNKNRTGLKISSGMYSKIKEERSEMTSGVPRSEEAKARMRGIKKSPEHVEKIRQANLGRIPINKGVSMSEEQKQKVSQSKMGSTPWNKGIPHTEETRKKISEKITGRKLSQEQIEKTAAANRGKIPWNKGLKKLKFAESIDIRNYVNSL